MLNDLGITGVKLYGINYTHVAYADDVAVFVKNRKEMMALERKLKEWKISTGLTVNDDKTKFMPFVMSNDGGTWESVDNFEYLGITLNRLGNVVWEPLLFKMEKNLIALSSIWLQSNNLVYCVRLVNSYVLSMMIYYMRADCNVSSATFLFIVLVS